MLSHGELPPQAAAASLRSSRPEARGFGSGLRARPAGACSGNPFTGFRSRVPLAAARRETEVRKLARLLSEAGREDEFIAALSDSRKVDELMEEFGIE